MRERQHLGTAEGPGRQRCPHLSFGQMTSPIQLWQLEISPWPQLLSVSCTTPKGPEFIDALERFRTQLKWSLSIIGKACDVLTGG